MSMIDFVKTPFPDNHNGFDYSPATYTDAIREVQNDAITAEQKKNEQKFLQMFASIFK